MYGLGFSGFLGVWFRVLLGVWFRAFRVFGCMV